MFEEDKPTACIIGRFSPWNDGHTKLIQTTIKYCDPTYKNKKSEAEQLLVLVRDTGQDISGIENKISSLIDNDFKVVKIPNITDMFFGKQLTVDMHRIDIGDEEPVNLQKTSAEEGAFQKDFFKNRG